jgi:hypothetical protein
MWGYVVFILRPILPYTGMAYGSRHANSRFLAFGNADTSVRHADEFMHQLSGPPRCAVLDELKSWA